MTDEWLHYLVLHMEGSIMRLNQLMHYRPLLGRSLMDLDQLLDVEEGALSLAKHTWMPAVDIQETAKEFLVRADVPGMAKENIDVRMDNHVLTIQGARTFEKKTEKKNLIRSERFEGEFYRQFTLPETANHAKISATCKDGILEIKIPKHAKGKKEVHKKVKIQ